MIRWLVPAFTLFALAIVAVVPFGLSSDYRLLPALLPGIGIVYWSVREVRRVNAVTVFVIGLIVDFLSGSFAGQWAVGYLGVLAAAVCVSRLGGDGIASLFTGAFFAIGIMLAVAFVPGLFPANGGVAYANVLSEALWVGLFALGFAAPVLFGLLRLLEGPRARSDGMLDYV